ncbi:MAG: TonB-dependent receptor, partial [Cyclonatronaceae bacterium]
MMMCTHPKFRFNSAAALLLMLAALCFMALPAAAQSSLNVLLLDNQNYKPIAGYSFVLENEAIGYRNTFTTNENGRATISGLSTSGEYVVRVPETETYFESQSEAVQLISNQQASVAVTVFQRVTADLDEVSITASSTSINLVDAQVASELSASELTRLPVEARDITRALYRLPNISQATGFYPEAPNISINGANSLFTNYQIDGFDNNENFLGGQRFRVPVGLTQNITALTNNFSAEYGRTSNGVINITTKSGSNELEGEVYAMTRPGPPLDASSSFAQRDLSGNQVKDGFARYQGGFSVGGPVKKDQTFFFLNAEHLTDLKDNLLNVPQLGVNETVPGNNHFSLMSGRLDHNWSDRLSSSLRANLGLVSIERQGGGLDGGVTFRSAGNEQDRNSLMLAQRTTYRGDGFISETGYQYGRFRWNYADPQQNDSPNVSVFAPNDELIANIGHPGFVFDDTENTHQIQQKFSFFTGGHVLKTGVDFRTSHFSLRGGGNPNGSWQVRLSEAQLEALRAGEVSSDLQPEALPDDVEVLSYGVELRPNAFEKRQNMIALYVEDQFSLGSRLNVSAGLRYDYDNLSKAGADQ